VGLVLSGGGMRGAYEVGVLAGIVDALGLRAHDTAPFDILAGTSVGAINAAFVASNSHVGHINVRQLRKRWANLKLSTHLKLQARGFVRQLLSGTRTPTDEDEYLGTSLISPGPLEDLVDEAIDWPNLHENIRNNKPQALLIPALEIETGRTIIFSELSSRSKYTPAEDPRRTAEIGPLRAVHVLASTAIPLVLPARRIGRYFYCDGGIRFNTPLAPVIRAGADHIIVISTTHRDLHGEHGHSEHPELYPTFTFLMGKVLNALLLDPIEHDLQMMDRLNEMVDVYEQGLSPEAQAQVDRFLHRTRGAYYRRLEKLAFFPSQDVGILAGDYIRENFASFELEFLPRRILERAAKSEPGTSADWATYLMFDGGFAQKLMTLGYDDAITRGAEIRRFFETR
jgi:NTE family protein